MRTDVMGVGFDNVTMAEAIEKAKALLDPERGDRLRGHA